MQALIFLINTAFSLYLMVVLLRIWLQWARADFYNPLSQFVVKATNPLIIPLRRILPSIGKIDTASVFFSAGFGHCTINLLTIPRVWPGIHR